MKKCKKCDIELAFIFTWTIPSSIRLGESYQIFVLYQCPKCKTIKVVEE